MGPPPETKQIPFQVDMAGIIEILGGSLYSRRDTAVRELLQNAHDAVMRRRASDLGYHGEIRIELDPAAGQLSIRDDGVGITPEEAETYLGTLGLGLSGILKKRGPTSARGRDATRIIGQFGVGLFSAFLLADRIVVESKKGAEHPAVRWEAGAGTMITIGPGRRAEPGTTVTLALSDDARAWAQEADAVKAAVAYYADFLPVPIYLGDARRRLNVMTPSWFEATPDLEMVSMELEQRFDDTPLDVVVVRQEEPTIQGALFVTRSRTPGFSGRPLITATVRRMVISPRIDGLFPPWATCYRGILELPDLMPTTSREDLIRDEAFARVQSDLHQLLLDRLRALQEEDPVKLRSILTWHRYAFAGAALEEPELRAILRDSYPFATSQGALTFAEVLERSRVEAALEPDADAVVWFNTDRGQEPWTNSVFRGLDVPCVQALRTFESTLLTLLAEDEETERVLVQVANPKNERFVSSVLGLRDLDDVPAEWQAFFTVFGARVRRDGFAGDLPVLAFPNKTAELVRDFKSLKQEGTVPPAFARMIDRHFEGQEDEQDQVILNTRHAIVRRALEGSVHSPLASVLRLLVHNALTTAGVAPGSETQETILKDLDWIADTIRERKGEA